jgi:glycosyltransferase involved in cell wall biosynthesis
MPEFFASKFGTAPSHPMVRLLAHLEQASIRFADATITCTDQMREVFLARGAPPQRVSVVFNGSDEAIFDHRRYPRREPDAEFRLISHGSLESRYGIDTIIRAVALLKQEIPGLRLSIYGDGSASAELYGLTEELGAGDSVFFSGGFVPVDELVQAIAEADAGVVAMRRDAFRDLTLCNKMYDFIAMRTPAIVSRTRSVEAYFDESCFVLFTPGDESDLARAIRNLHQHRDLSAELAAEAHQMAAPHAWVRQRERYLAVVNQLVKGSAVAWRAGGPSQQGKQTGAETVFLVTSYPGQPSVAELAAQSAAGRRPRRAYVELARLLDAKVIDSHHMATSARWLSRWLARTLSMPVGQVCEALLGGSEPRTICAWADRLGVPLALVAKLGRRRLDLVLVSDWLSRPKKAVLMRTFRAHSNLRAILNSSSVQRQIAIDRLGVPPEKLHFVPLPVDEMFWRPGPDSVENLICAVGMEARDYPTLMEAVRGMEVDVELAVGTIVLAQGSAGAADVDSGTDPAHFDLLRGSFGHRFHREGMEALEREGLPPNVRLRTQLTPLELRALYARSRLVVVPLHDVDSDCGMSTIIEAMAMARPVVVTRTTGQVDVVVDREHGVYVPPGDARALGRAIGHLLDHPDEARQMGRAGRDLIEERHTLDAHVERLIRLLRPARQADP